MKTKCNHKKSILSVFCIFLFCTWLCSCIPTPISLPSKKQTVGYCVDVLGPSNTSYTTAILSTLEKMQSEELIRLQVNYSVLKEEYLSSLMSLAQDNQLVFCSSLMAEECAECASQHPNTFFVVFDFFPIHPSNKITPSLTNVCYVLFGEESAASIAGYISTFIDTSLSPALYFPGSSLSPMKNRLHNSFILGIEKGDPSFSKPVFIFTEEDASPQNIKSLAKEARFSTVGCIFYLPSSYYASILQNSTSPVLNDKTAPWDILLIGGEQVQYNSLACVLRKNYSYITESIINSYLAGDLTAGITIFGKEDNAFLFSPVSYPFSEESLQSISEFLRSKKEISTAEK